MAWLDGVLRGVRTRLIPPPHPWRRDSDAAKRVRFGYLAVTLYTMPSPLAPAELVVP
jgi:hypothetical protein